MQERKKGVGEMCLEEEKRPKNEKNSQKHTI